MSSLLKKLPTFVITMPNEISRQNKSKKQLKGICENYEFFFANGKPNKFPSTYTSWKRRFYFGRDLTLGEFGCFNSHKLVLEKIVSKKIEKALILEDDFVFLDSFKKSINDLLKCSYDWELVRLLSKPKLNKRMKKTVADLSDNYKLVRLSTSPGGAYAYIITLMGAKKLLSAMDKIWCPVDLVMGQPWRTDLEILTVMPPIATWDQSFKSAIGDERFKKRQLKGWRKYILPLSRFYFKIFEGSFRKYFFFKKYFKR
jgi:glycosyl transferase family 25